MAICDDFPWRMRMAKVDMVGIREKFTNRKIAERQRIHNQLASNLLQSRKDIANEIAVIRTAVIRIAAISIR